jgi:hypothetical protein
MGLSLDLDRVLRRLIRCSRLLYQLDYFVKLDRDIPTSS